MYLKLLNFEQKTAFISLAKHFFMTDDIFDEFEEKILDRFIDEMNLKEADLALNMGFEESVKSFYDSSPETKRTVMLELLCACFCNNEIDEEQKNLLDQISNKLGMDDEFMDEATRWAKYSTAMVRAGLKLIGRS